VSENKERLRKEATASRERLVSTFGELGKAVSQTRDEAVSSARRAAPFAGAALAALIFLRIRRSRR
jgi:hypothetical protein